MPIDTEIRHYNYQGDVWGKYRDIVNSGRDFIEKYLSAFSDRESATDFSVRKDLTYLPAFAKAAVMEVNNAIYQRLTDIIRVGGPPSYQSACLGLNGGVDNKSSTMTYFIGTKVLPEMLNLQKVGVFIDRPQLNDKPTLSNPIPYLYTYNAEDILSWSEDEFGNLTTVLLRESIDEIDEHTGLVTGLVDKYRLLTLKDNKVLVKFYDKDGEDLESYVINIPAIPFVVGEIGSSLLVDIADHQIALLNIASSDLAFILYANFPFYTEQYDAMDTFALPSGTASEVVTSGPSESPNRRIKVGATKGRRYPKNVERPGFINPSSESLEASMRKQQEIKEEIRTLINLTIANLKPVRASADSKIQDDRTLEAGLSYIGLELNTFETRLAHIWALYENPENPEIPTIKYPLNYSLKSDSQRLKDATDLDSFTTKIPSLEFKKAVAKELVRTTMGSKITADQLTTIDNEIENAKVFIVDPTSIRDDHDAGFVSTELASELRGYPKGEIEQAKIDHAERLRRIAISQSKGVAGEITNPVDRGLSDLG